MVVLFAVFVHNVQSAIDGDGISELSSIACNMYDAVIIYPPFKLNWALYNWPQKSINCL